MVGDDEISGAGEDEISGAGEVTSTVFQVQTEMSSVSRN